MDVNSLINGSSTSTNTIDTSTIMTSLMPFIVISTLITVALGALYVLSAITTYRSRRAVIEMRDLLREMNERDKIRTQSNMTTAPIASTHAPYELTDIPPPQ